MTSSIRRDVISSVVTSSGLSVTSSVSSTGSSRDPPPPLSLPGNLPLQPGAGPGADGRKQRRSSCRPTFVVPIACDVDDDDDCAFQRDRAGAGGGGEGGEGRRTNGDLPERRRHSVCCVLTRTLYTVSGKKGTNSILGITSSNTDQFSSSVTICLKLAINLLLNFPPNLKRVATLPCEKLMSEN